MTAASAKPHPSIGEPSAAAADAMPQASSSESIASVSGTVTNEAGKALPRANVAIKSTSGLRQTAKTDKNGKFWIGSLPAGTYTISVTADGFKNFEVPHIPLAEGDSVPLDVMMQAGEPGTPVTTDETAPASSASAQTTATATPAETQQPQAGADWLNVTPYLPPPPPGAKAPASYVSQSEPQVTAKATHTGGKTGAIGGQVTDNSGAVITGATVTVSNASGFKQTATSNDQGVYSVTDLPPGTYDISVSAPKFKPFQSSGLTVAAGDTLPLDAALEAGGVSTEVNVEAGGGVEIETEKAEVSGTITQKEVSTLGLNGRNFTALITLTPGVSNQTGVDEAKVGVLGSVKYSVNGGRVEYNSFTVDGSDVLNTGLSGSTSTLVVYPSLDAIQEVKVLTSNYGAEYGRTASGSVQVTTRSGGAHWHGNAYEFVRNEFFNSRNYFDQGSKAPLYRRNDFGGTIGGPLWIPGHYNLDKTKTFVFFSEEARIEKSPSELQPNFNQAVPTLSERQGDFSDVCPSPNDPSDLKILKTAPSGQPGAYIFPIASFPDCPGVPNAGVPGFRQLFFNQGPNNTYTYNNLVNPATNAAAGLDPNALAILGTNLIPLPNSFTGCTSSLVGAVNHTTGQPIMPCYDAVISEPTHWREELFRIDHNFNSHVHSMFHYIHDSWDTVTPTPNWGHVKNSFPTVQNKFVGPGLDLVFRLTQTISATLLNETAFSYTNSHITLADRNGPGGANFQRPAGLGDPAPAQLAACVPSSTSVSTCPMGYLFDNGFGGKAPGVVVAGNDQAYGGAGFTVDPSYMPWEHTNPTYDFRDDVSKGWGKHLFQFGVQYVLAQVNETNGALGAAFGDTQGLLTFSNVNGGLLNTGNAFANFLYNDGPTTLGTNAIQSYSQDSTQLRYYNRYQTAEPYIQDDWKVLPRLTVNLGIRFSLFGNYHEKYLQAYNWEPQAFSQQLAAQLRVDPYTGQLFGAGTVKPIPLTLSNLDPRITNGIVQCGEHGVPFGCVNTHIFNPAPRVGFAWDPRGNGKTSIRAGYGLFYEHGTGDEANTGSLEASAPDVLNVTQPFPVGYACIGNYGPDCNPNGVSLPGAYPINVTSLPSQTKYSYSQQWSLSVEQQLPRNFVATFAYVGSKGTHLTVERNLNQLRPISPALNPFALHEPFILEVAGETQTDCDNVGTTSNPIFALQNGVVVSASNPASINMQVACQGQSTNVNHPPIAVANTFRPYPGLGNIYALQNGADSSYHGFQTTIRRTKGPLTAGAAYSFSHSIDDSSDRTDPTFVDSLDLRSNKASSNFDQRHLLNVSYIYNLPKLSLLFRWLFDPQPAADSQTVPAPAQPSRLMRWFGDGWQWSGITTYQTGTPFSVVNGGGNGSVAVPDNAGVANGYSDNNGNPVYSYPDLATNPASPAISRNGSSFGPLLLNPNDFVAPRGLTFGNAGRNFLNNPSRTNSDMSLLKHFPIHEGSEVEFRAEAFNVFNHTQFRIYNPDLGNTGSNTISCYGGPNYSAGAYFPGGADCLTGNSFLHPVDAHRPRTVQFALKYSF